MYHWKTLKPLQPKRLWDYLTFLTLLRFQRNSVKYHIWVHVACYAHPWICWQHLVEWITVDSWLCGLMSETQEHCMIVCFSCQKYKEFERAVRVEEIDGLRLVKRLAESMEEMFHKKAQAMKVRFPTLIFIHHTNNLNKPKIISTNNNDVKTAKRDFLAPYVQVFVIWYVKEWRSKNRWQEEADRLQPPETLSASITSLAPSHVLWL